MPCAVVLARLWFCEIVWPLQKMLKQAYAAGLYLFAEHYLMCQLHEKMALCLIDQTDKAGVTRAGETAFHIHQMLVDHIRILGRYSLDVVILFVHGDMPPKIGKPWGGPAALTLRLSGRRVVTARGPGSYQLVWCTKSCQHPLFGYKNCVGASSGQWSTDGTSTSDGRIIPVLPLLLYIGAHVYEAHSMRTTGKYILEGHCHVDRSTGRYTSCEKIVQAPSIGYTAVGFCFSKTAASVRCAFSCCSR